VSTTPAPTPAASSASGDQHGVVGCKKTNQCWIEVQVTEEDGSPAVGEEYIITCPDGETLTGKLDKTGSVRFDQIACGVCQVKLPNFDEVEVVKVPAPAYSFDWIAVELLESENGAPVAGDPYWIEDPSGTVHEGKLDSKGYVRVDKIPSGTCKVRFPDTATEETILKTTSFDDPARWVPLAARDWIELELLEMDGQPAAGEPYWVKLPDGTIREGDLDKKGFARIDGIPSGICQVKFQDTDIQEVDRTTPPPVVAAPIPGTLSWIEFEFTEADDVTPVPNVPYSVTLPDGAIRKGKLDDEGKVRLEDVPAGVCQADFSFEESECEKV
jgi:hypothetical protein